jgi:hypothetical protein
MTITLGELMECGVVDFSAPEWDFDKYDQEQHERLVAKITDRFYFREIGILPVGRWKREFLRNLNEIMPKYKPLYKALADGANILTDEDEWSKSRDIYSEFPATMLGDNQDYASNGRDRQSERQRIGSFAEAAERIASRYNDVDVLILNEIDSMFSSLLTVSMNGY